jgi:hypothetical protein
VHSRADRSWALEIANTGEVAIYDVECVLPANAINWHLMAEVLPSYPIRVLEPEDRVRIHLVVTLGGPAAVDVTLRGRRGDDGSPYERGRMLTLT